MIRFTILSRFLPACSMEPEPEAFVFRGPCVLCGAVVPWATLVMVRVWRVANDGQWTWRWAAVHETCWEAWLWSWHAAWDTTSWFNDLFLRQLQFLILHASPMCHSNIVLHEIPPPIGVTWYQNLFIHKKAPANGQTLYDHGFIMHWWGAKLSLMN